jgi:hypothetical protein
VRPYCPTCMNTSNHPAGKISSQSTRSSPPTRTLSSTCSFLRRTSHKLSKNTRQQSPPRSLHIRPETSSVCKRLRRQMHGRKRLHNR